MMRAVLLKNNNYLFIIVIVLMSVLAFSATMVIVILRPEQDNVPIISQIFLFSTTITASILTFVKAEQVSIQSKETHDLVNSRMTEFMETLEKSAQKSSVIARAEGVAEGQAEANERTDVLVSG